MKLVSEMDKAVADAKKAVSEIEPNTKALETLESQWKIFKDSLDKQIAMWKNVLHVAAVARNTWASVGRIKTVWDCAKELPLNPMAQIQIPVTLETLGEPRSAWHKEVYQYLISKIPEARAAVERTATVEGFPYTVAWKTLLEQIERGSNDRHAKVNRLNVAFLKKSASKDIEFIKPGLPSQTNLPFRNLEDERSSEAWRKYPFRASQVGNIIFSDADIPRFVASGDSLKKKFTTGDEIYGRAFWPTAVW